MTMWMWASLALLSAAPAQDPSETPRTDPSASMRLLCEGQSTSLAERTSLHFGATGKLSTTTFYGERRRAERVMFKMAGGSARIHMSPGLITPVNSGGEDGWWAVDALKVTEDSITGKFRINIINKPSFQIDRNTGAIDLGGAYPFRGMCEKVTRTERKF